MIDDITYPQVIVVHFLFIDVRYFQSSVIVRVHFWLFLLYLLLLFLWISQVQGFLRLLLVKGPSPTIIGQSSTLFSHLASHGSDVSSFPRHSSVISRAEATIHSAMRLSRRVEST